MRISSTLKVAGLAGLAMLAACKQGDTPAAAPVIPDIALPDLSLKTLQDVTKELSSDAFEGRSPGTAGEE